MLLNHIWDGQVLSSGRPKLNPVWNKRRKRGLGLGTNAVDSTEDTRESALCSEVHLKDIFSSAQRSEKEKRNENQQMMTTTPSRFLVMMLCPGLSCLAWSWACRLSVVVCRSSFVECVCPFKMFFFSNNLSAWRILLILFLHAPWILLTIISTHCSLNHRPYPYPSILV